MQPVDWSKYRNFSRSEFVCKCGCGRADMDPAFLARLQRVRKWYARGMFITSGYRCLEYDRDIGGKGEHTLGKAADIRIMGIGTVRLIIFAYLFGFRRIGAKQHGPRLQRFLHLGSANTDRYRPAFWTY